MIEYGTRSNETIETRTAVESIKERVYLAVKELCVGGSDVRGRLVISVNILMPLSPDEFPDGIKEDFKACIKGFIQLIKGIKIEKYYSAKCFRNRAGE